jgi:hypothetical protein
MPETQAADASKEPVVKFKRLLFQDLTKPRSIGQGLNGKLNAIKVPETAQEDESEAMAIDSIPESESTLSSEMDVDPKEDSNQTKDDTAVFLDFEYRNIDDETGNLIPSVNSKGKTFDPDAEYRRPKLHFKGKGNLSYFLKHFGLFGKQALKSLILFHVLFFIDPGIIKEGTIVAVVVKENANGELIFHWISHAFDTMEKYSKYACDDSIGMTPEVYEETQKSVNFSQNTSSLFPDAGHSFNGLSNLKA